MTCLGRNWFSAMLEMVPGVMNGGNNYVYVSGIIYCTRLFCDR